jgi:TP901 family phage tail tape measure protein
MSNENKRKYIVEFDVNKASLNQLKSTIQEIQKMSVGDFKAASPQGFNSFEEARTELQRIKKLTAEVDKALEDAFNPQMGVPNLTKLTDSIKKIGVDKIARSWDQLGAVGGSATRQLATGLIATNTQLKQSHKLLDDMATSFKNTVKWGISSTAFNTMTNSLSSAWGYAKNLNKVLTDIRIVSDQSASDMERFAKQAAKAAKELGATTLDYGNAALLYYQQGDSAEQVAEKANLTVKMANVLGASASEVSNYMTAIWNNFDDGSRSLEYYADVLTKLGAATASSAEEISDGLEKFAAVANTVDLSYEYATAALTTITATTRQSADIVGTALKTLFARIQDLELGETLDDGTTLGKYSEALEKVGISLKGQDGQLRSMDDLLDDMGSKWQTLTKNQKIALAQTVAGTRQYTQLVALMDNWDVMQQNITLAQEATGSLQEQQDKYMESTAAHLNKLTASAERFMDALIDDGVINGLIDSLATVTSLLGNFVEGVGGGTNALFMLGSIGADVFSKQITNSLLITIQNLKTAARAAQETKTSFSNLGAMDVL